MLTNIRLLMMDFGRSRRGSLEANLFMGETPSKSLLGGSAKSYSSLITVICRGGFLAPHWHSVLNSIVIVLALLRSLTVRTTVLRGHFAGLEDRSWYYTKRSLRLTSWPCWFLFRYCMICTEQGRDLYVRCCQLAGLLRKGFGVVIVVRGDRAGGPLHCV